MTRMDADEALRAELTAELKAAAEAYCVALHHCDASVLAELFAPEAHLYAVEGGALVDLPRDLWLERVGSRERPGPGSRPEFHIETVDFSGPETGLVRLTVAVGPRRFTDYLNWLKVGGVWRVIAKTYRVAGEA
jgi:hypothetical protein